MESRLKFLESQGLSRAGSSCDDGGGFVKGSKMLVVSYTSFPLDQSTVTAVTSEVLIVPQPFSAHPPLKELDLSPYIV